MSEKKLQHQIVMSFSQHRPQDMGLLWSTPNRTFSVRDGQTQKATGMIAGVSDLIHFDNKQFRGCEIKVRGSQHNSKHVRQQLEWGERIIRAGGDWAIITSIEEFWSFINGGSVEYNAKKVREMIDGGGSKITFK